MKSIAVTAAAVYFASMASAATAAKSGVEQPSSAPIINQPVVQGCFSSLGELEFHSIEDFNSRGKCGQDICRLIMGKPVAATTEGAKCFCGDKYPPKSTLADDKMCNISCTGFGEDACGGVGFYTIYNTGLSLYGIEFSDDSTASKSGSASGTAVTTSPSGQTVFVTQSSDSNAAKSGGTNTAGIAAGVVVAVVAVAGIVGGAFFFIRRRRNREIEEEHRRNAAVNSFVNGKPPSSSGGFSISDARLDPVMSQRRMSDGSIADNQDYSRKILRVTNA